MYLLDEFLYENALIWFVSTFLILSDSNSNDISVICRCLQTLVSDSDLLLFYWTERNQECRFVDMTHIYEKSGGATNNVEGIIFPLGWSTPPLVPTPLANINDLVSALRVCKIFCHINKATLLISLNSVKE